jgi:hypothetical protein
MNCCYCKKILLNSLINYYDCIDCNCTFIFYNNGSPRIAYLYYKIYYFYFDFNSKYYALYKKDSFSQIYKFDNLPNITPQNIESKINTILAFL